MLQGLTLPALIRRLGLRDDGLGRREEITARIAAADAAITCLIEQVLEAKRRALLELREQGSIHDEVLHRLERELDLEEKRVHLAAYLGGGGTHLEH